MKRILAIVLCIIVMLGIAACNNNNSGINDDSSFNSGKLPVNENLPVEETSYPGNIFPIDGVNRYEHLKLKAPSKKVDVADYQNYGIEQIEIYLNAIAQDKAITYNTDYLCLELTKRKYAIYTQEDFDKIDLILIDAENLLKKYILEDELLLEIESNVGVGVGNVKYYYGTYNDMYFIVEKRFSFTGGVELRLEIGNMTFAYTYQEGESLYVWKSGWEDVKRIKFAYEEGLVPIEVLEEYYPHELLRLAKANTYKGEGWERNLVSVSNANILQEEGNPFLINVHAKKRYRLSPSGSLGVLIWYNIGYLDNFKILPYGVTNIEYGFVNHNGDITGNKSLCTDNVEDIREMLIWPRLIHYNRDGSIKNVEFLAVNNHQISKDFFKDDSGWLRIYINLEYTNGYKETHYGKKLYYNVEKSQYDAESDKYYDVYSFGENFIQAKNKNSNNIIFKLIKKMIQYFSEF